MSVMAEKSADATAIRPFTIETPESDLDDLRARIVATRFPEQETVDDISQGPQLAMMQALHALLGGGVRLEQVRGS